MGGWPGEGGAGWKLHFLAFFLEESRSPPLEEVGAPGEDPQNPLNTATSGLLMG